jgi:hypothetical protein
VAVAHRRAAAIVASRPLERDGKFMSFGLLKAPIASNGV